MDFRSLEDGLALDRRGPFSLMTSGTEGKKSVDAATHTHTHTEE
jgi:hypothetical protein